MYSSWLNFHFLQHALYIICDQLTFGFFRSTFFTQVGNVTRTWTVGKAVVFDESFEHSAWNENAKEPRYVLQVHTWHPGLMPLVDLPAHYAVEGDEMVERVEL